MQTNKLYLIVRENDQDYTCDIEAYCQLKGWSFHPMSERRRYVVRDELKDAPQIDCLCGPMWGGEHNGFAVIRYEDQAAYNQLSS